MEMLAHDEIRQGINFSVWIIAILIGEHWVVKRSARLLPYGIAMTTLATVGVVASLYELTPVYWFFQIGWCLFATVMTYKIHHAFKEFYEPNNA